MGRHFHLLAAGSAVSAYGSFLNLVALNLFAYEATGSAFQTGLLMAVRLAASVVGGLLAGTLAARLDRKRIMVTSDLAQAGALLSLALLPALADRGLLYAVAITTGLCATCSSVALRTAVPEIVGAESRVRANALLVTCRSLAMVAGFASAGPVVSWLGYRAAFLIDAATFLLAAANLARLPIRTRSPGTAADAPAPAAPPTGNAAGAANAGAANADEAAAGEAVTPQAVAREAAAGEAAAGAAPASGTGPVGGQEPRPPAPSTPPAGSPSPATPPKTRPGGGSTGLLADHRVALALLRLTPLVALMIALRVSDGFGSSAHSVGLPIHSRELDPAHPAVFISQFWATWAVGNILAQRFTARHAQRHGAPSERLFALGVMVMSAAFILAFTGLPTPLAIVVFLIAGAADGFTENAYISRLQATPDHVRAHLFGFSAMVENVGFGLGMVVSASLLERFSPLQVVSGMHGSALLLALGLLLVIGWLSRRTTRSVSPSATLPDPEPAPAPAAAPGPDPQAPSGPAVPRAGTATPQPSRSERTTR